MLFFFKTTNRQAVGHTGNPKSWSATNPLLILAGWSFIGCALSLQPLSAQQNANAPHRLPLPSEPSVKEEAQIRKLRVPQQQLKGLSTKLGLMYRDSADVQITSDPRSGHLIVMAPATMQSKIATDIRQLLATNPNGVMKGSSESFTYQLRHVNWQSAEQQFSQFTGNPPSITKSRHGMHAAFRLTSPMMMGTTITVHRRLNQVVVNAAPEKVEAWKRVLAVVDSPMQSQREITVIVRLEKAEPAPIQRALRLLSAAERRPSHSDPSNHSTVNPVRPVAFQPPPPGAPGGTVATPEATDPATDQGNDQSANETSDDKDGGAGVIGDTQIEFVPELGTIIIKGAKRDVQRVMDVIKQIEEQSKVTKPGVEVVPLRHADSNAVADLLKQLYDDVLSARQGSVSITSLDAPNALLLIGRSEAIKSLLELIQKIDQPIDETNGLRVFRLQHASGDRRGANDSQLLHGSSRR